MTLKLVEITICFIGNRRKPNSIYDWQNESKEVKYGVVRDRNRSAGNGIQEPNAETICETQLPEKDDCV